MKRQRFVILDRDGTVIVEKNYLSDPKEVELIPGAASALVKLRSHGLGLVLITNQSAIGRGIIDRERLELIHERLCELLETEGVLLDGIYYCPHLPEDNCTCRKPRTGMVELAAEELNITPQECFIIGDKVCDIELGQRIGATTFLVCTGYGAGVAAGNEVNPDYIADGLPEAAKIITQLLADKEKT